MNGLIRRNALPICLVFACSTPSDPQGGSFSGGESSTTGGTASNGTSAASSDATTQGSSSGIMSTTGDDVTAASLTEDGSASDPGSSSGAMSSGEDTSGTSAESSSGGPGDASSDSATTEDAASTGLECPSAEVTFTPTIPTVVLLIDQSGSMTQNFGGVTRWNAVRDALTGAGGVIESLQGQVRFGLALYTSHDGNQGGAQCPILTEVAPALDNLAAIQAVYDPADPEDETPTGEALAVVASSLLEFAEAGPKIIVLATDGEPDTCAQPNPQNGQDESIDAVEAAFTAGIETFVISVGNDVGTEHLQDLANAGIGWQDGDPLATYYVPADQQAMIDTFSTIVGGVRDCRLVLDAEILPGQGDRGTVTINGELVPYEDPDGWHVLSPTEIELVGEACEQIQGGNVDVRVEFTCEALVPS